MASSATPLIVEVGKSICLSLWGAISPHMVNMVVSCFGFSGNVESLQEKSKRLIDKAYDVEKEVTDLENSRRKVRKTEVASWLEEVRILNIEFVNLQRDLLRQNKFMNRFLSGGKVLELILRFDELLQQPNDFHGLLVLDAERTGGNQLLTTKLFGEAFEKNVEKILQWMVTDKISTVGIYGMGGVGKTTLAKHIYNLLLEKTNVCWVTVSREFGINKLQHDIAEFITLDLSTESDEDKRAASLKKALSRNNDFVLILDDVWDNFDLEKVGNPHLLEGCRLIITTRMMEVCRRIDCNEIIQVQTLLVEEAWNLFKKLLGQQTILTQQVEEIAKDVVKECDGLPLGIATMAGSMRGVTDIHVWKNALTELNESLFGQDDNIVMKEKVFKVLKYSFDRLDPSYTSQNKIRNGYTKLQLCFLYCSLYPEDFPIEKIELINRFISEKLIDHRKSRGAKFNKGHEVLDKLVKACLLESTQLFDGRESHESVKMHDLVRDMAIEITKDNPKFKVLAGLSLQEFPSEEYYWTEDLEKMSLMENDITEIPQGMSPNCPKLSTLLLNRNMKLTIIPDSFFSLMCGLSVLDLSWTSIRVLPNSVCDLESLNVLDLAYCRALEDVANLGKLKALEELYLTNCSKIREVPQGLENLVNLKVLSLLIHGLKMLPTGMLPKLQHLQHLFLPFCIQVVVKEIESLKKLEKVFCEVKDVYDFNSFVRSQQSGQGNITSYYIIIGDYGADFGLGLSSGFYCKSVVVYKCNLKKGEGNEVILLGQDIQHLELTYCEGLSSCFSDDLQRLGSPRSIRTLEFSGCEGTECIARLTTTPHLMMAQQEELNSLENFELFDMPDLMGLVVADATAIALTTPPLITGLFSSLKRLGIQGCHKIKKLGLLDLQNLESINIVNCKEIEEIIQVADEWRGVVVSLPKLEDLNLFDLPKLKSICTEEAKMCCTSIENIHLHGCPKVKKLPLLFLSSSSAEDGRHSSYSAPPNLKEIRTEEEWWESLEWDHPTHKDILLPFCSF